jgi:uncharacterized protein YciI
MKRFLYFYLMRNRPEAIRKVVPAHVQHWKTRNVPEYVGGPFADLTGGLIPFAAASLEDTQQVIHDDPFLLRIFPSTNGSKNGLSS